MVFVWPFTLETLAQVDAYRAPLPGAPGPFEWPRLAFRWPLTLETLSQVDAYRAPIDPQAQSASCPPTPQRGDGVDDVDGDRDAELQGSSASEGRREPTMYYELGRPGPSTVHPLQEPILSPGDPVLPARAPIVPVRGELWESPGRSTAVAIPAAPRRRRKSRTTAGPPPAKYAVRRLRNEVTDPAAEPAKKLSPAQHAVRQLYHQLPGPIRKVGGEQSLAAPKAPDQTADPPKPMQPERADPRATPAREQVADPVPPKPPLRRILGSWRNPLRLFSASAPAIETGKQSSRRSLYFNLSHTLKLFGDFLFSLARNLFHFLATIVGYCFFSSGSSLPVWEPATARNIHKLILDLSDTLLALLGSGVLAATAGVLSVQAVEGVPASADTMKIASFAGLVSSGLMFSWPLSSAIVSTLRGKPRNLLWVHIITSAVVLSYVRACLVTYLAARWLSYPDPQGLVTAAAVAAVPFTVECMVFILALLIRPPPSQLLLVAVFLVSGFDVLAGWAFVLVAQALGHEIFSPSSGAAGGAVYGILHCSWFIVQSVFTMPR